MISNNNFMIFFVISCSKAITSDYLKGICYISMENCVNKGDYSSLKSRLFILNKWAFPDDETETETINW